MRHSLPATLSLEIEAQSPAWPAWIDVGQLENALINLVMNARDAMAGRGGVIKIRTWNQRVTRSSGQRQDMVALEVIDHGSGMSQAVKARVFEPSSPPKPPAAAAAWGCRWCMACAPVWRPGGAGERAGAGDDGAAAAAASVDRG